MATQKVPLARAQNTKPRTPYNKPNPADPVEDGTDDGGIDRHDLPDAKQPTGATPIDPADSPPDPPKAPLFRKPQVYPDLGGTREVHYASPLAATLFARFDPNNSEEQPAEHAVFIDTRLQQRGYI